VGDTFIPLYTRVGHVIYLRGISLGVAPPLESIRLQVQNITIQKRIIVGNLQVLRNEIDNTDNNYMATVLKS
jgi:hypothetical protein